MFWVPLRVNRAALRFGLLSKSVVKRQILLSELRSAWPAGLLSLWPQVRVVPGAATFPGLIPVCPSTSATKPSRSSHSDGTTSRLLDRSTRAFLPIHSPHPPSVARPPTPHL